MQQLTTGAGFEAFAKRALYEYCQEELGKCSVTHFLVQNDPDTGKPLAAPELRQLSWEVGMDTRAIRIAEAQFAEKTEAAAVASIWYQSEESCVMLVVQHLHGTLAHKIPVTRTDEGPRFGRLEDLAIADEDEQEDDGEDENS